jgi:hypothetical protein
MIEYRSAEVKRGDLLATIAAYKSHVDEAMGLGDFEEACYWQDQVDGVMEELDRL